MDVGIEDLTAFFHYGLGPSIAPNSLSARGLKTHHVLDAKQPFTVRYIMGVAGIPKNFGELIRVVTPASSSV